MKFNEIIFKLESTYDLVDRVPFIVSQADRKSDFKLYGLQVFTLDSEGQAGVNQRIDFYGKDMGGEGEACFFKADQAPEKLWKSQQRLDAEAAAKAAAEAEAKGEAGAGAGVIA